MPSRTVPSTAVKLLLFLSAAALLGAALGCGSDDPAQQDPIEVIVPITPGIYSIRSEVTTCPDSSGATETVVVDTTDIACEFNVTAFVESFDDDVPVVVTSATSEEQDGHYNIDVEFRIEFLPCYIYFRTVLEGDVTDTSFYFEGTSFLDRIEGAESIYDAICEDEWEFLFEEDECPTTVFDAVYLGPDTTGACD